MIELDGQLVSAQESLDILAEMEQRSRAAATRLPQLTQTRDIWDGLVFTVAGARVVAAMNEVSEMLPFQERITHVPGAKPWMLGLANVRSSLLPVIDLQAFLGLKAIVPSKSTRILVLRLRGLVVGLVVPSVQGMRHFSKSDKLPNARMKGVLGAYVYDAFNVGGEVWPVFNMHALAADPGFRSAAQ
ncbi:MAG: purine-binding chemotaxis protein CheW [Gammaproteobacteria bacterium]|nr:purine-binding chemotaxis protein CheW [Gammaproteobacteria bacterium]